MEFVHQTSFPHIVQRCGGNAGVRSLSCSERFLARAFARLSLPERPLKL